MRYYTATSNDLEERSRRLNSDRRFARAAGARGASTDRRKDFSRPSRRHRSLAVAAADALVDISLGYRLSDIAAHAVMRRTDRYVLTTLYDGSDRVVEDVAVRLG